MYVASLIINATCQTMNIMATLQLNKLDSSFDVDIDIVKLLSITKHKMHINLKDAGYNEFECFY